MTAHVIRQVDPAKRIETILGRVAQRDSMRPARERRETLALGLQAPYHKVDDFSGRYPVSRQFSSGKRNDSAGRFEDLALPRHIRGASSRHIDKRPDPGIAR